MLHRDAFRRVSLAAALSLSAVACIGSGGDGDPGPAFLAGAGARDPGTGASFAFTWSIEQADTLAPQTCAQAGAATVRLVVDADHFDFPCTDGQGRTETLAPSSYALTVHLLDAQGAELSVTQTMTVPLAAGQVVSLGDVIFDVI